MDKAQPQGKDVQAGAIQKVYLDNINDPEIADIWEAILSRVATDSQIVEFQRGMKDAKKAY